MGAIFYLSSGAVKSMFESIFFDLDGTLLDEEKARDLAIKDFYDLFLSETNKSLEEFVDCWREGINKFFPLFTQGKLSFVEQRRERIRLLFLESPLSDSKKEIRLFSQTCLSNFKSPFLRTDSNHVSFN